MKHRMIEYFYWLNYYRNIYRWGGPEALCAANPRLKRRRKKRKNRRRAGITVINLI